MPESIKIFGYRIASIVFLGILLSSFTAYAAPAVTPPNVTNQGITISPFLLERQMEKGQTLNEVIDVTNNSTETLPVNVTINDFQPIGENGQSQFLDPGQGNPTYSLSSWIKIQQSPTLYLKSNQTTSLAFSISPPLNAEDGGHYGAILFSFQSPGAAGTNVVVTQKVGAIILVKLGRVNEIGTIASFAPQKSFYEYPPVTFVTRFQNTGNVHTQPRGGISIFNSFGKQVGSVLVNENANNVLPQTTRAFTSTWTDKFAFGKYTAQEKLVIGDTGQVVESTATFWVLPWKLALGVAIGLFLLILILIYSVRKYNQWVLEKAYASQQERRMRRR